MEKGFLITIEPLWWDTKGHKWQAAGEKIVPFSGFAVNLEAYRCKKCDLIIFQYAGTS